MTTFLQGRFAPALALVVAATGAARADPPPAPAAGVEEPVQRRVVVPPQPGARRITVQIDPVDQARRLAMLPPRPQIVTPGTPGGSGGGHAAVPGRAQHGWFWERVPTGLDDSRGRFLSAMTALADPVPGGTPVRAPRIQHLQNIAHAHGPAILRATAGTRVSPALVLAVISVESAGRSDAVSHAGAQGLMQLIPATAARFGVANSFDATQNIRGGVAYLDWLIGHFGGDVVLALAGYNAGEGAVRRNNGVPPFAETRDYVPKVLAAWQVARGLCVIPPELPTDPCIFHVGRAG